MMEDGGSDGKMGHFDMREAVRQAAKEGAAGGAKKGREKISRWKMAKLKTKEKRLAKQGVIIRADSAVAAKPAVPALHVTPVSAVSMIPCIQQHNAEQNAS